MSEADLALKMASRRLLWRMGFSARIDVPLRAVVPHVAGRRSSSRYETFTDLDVLGVTITPGFALRAVICDCKTSPRGSTERMFWIRGVSDFFEADDAWMVRSGGVTAASRQLAARLRISVLEPADLTKLEGYHPTDLDLVEGPLRVLFDEEHVAEYMKRLTEQDKKLGPLIEYRQFDYWVYEEHRNLIQVVAHLEQVRKNLEARQPAHRALFMDCAWLYALSLARAAQHVRAVHVSDIDTALRQYLFGGQIALQEKQQLAYELQRMLARRVSATEGSGLLPPWYGDLLELLTRHLRRPTKITEELRYAEWLAEAAMHKYPANPVDAFRATFDSVAAKLLADVCGFLVRAAQLDPGFRTFAQSALSMTGGMGARNDADTPTAPAESDRSRFSGPEQLPLVDQESDPS